MRICPSQSTVMNLNVESTVSSPQSDSNHTARRFAPSNGHPPAQRIDAEMDLRAANDVQVDHVAEVVDVTVEKVVAMRGGRMQRPLVRNSFYPSS